MAQPDNRKKALQNSDQSWRQNYRDYTGRRGTQTEKNNFKRDYVSEENVDARMGEGAYQQMLKEAEQRQFGTRGVTPLEDRTRKEQREYDRFKKRFDRDLRNNRLQPRSSASNSSTPNSSTQQINQSSTTTPIQSEEKPLIQSRVVFPALYGFNSTPRFNFSQAWINSSQNQNQNTPYAGQEEHQKQNDIANQNIYKPDPIKATTSDVANIQRKMGVPVTGIWDESTTEAIKKWQGENGLEQTGMWDEATTNSHESQRQAQIRQRLGFESEDAVKQWQIENGYDSTGQLNGEQISVWNENTRKQMTSGNANTPNESVTEESVYDANKPTFWQSMAEELPIYGTIQSGKRLFQEPFSWQNAGDFAGDLASDALMFVPGIGWAAKAIKAGRTAKKVANTGKALKLLPAANRTQMALPVAGGAQKALPVAGGAQRALPSSKGIMQMLPESSVGVPATVSRGGVPATVSSTTGTVMRPGSGTFETGALASRPNPKQLTYTDPNGVTIYPKGYQHPGLPAAEEIPYIPVNKKGGCINYFQQGGAAPQQDVQQQIIQLVQAAMKGDQKATQTIQQVIQAAKQGDQQAVQLAQMIQQVAEQMKGQATMAKWGSKLKHIKSLKYTKGGKACPSCENGGKPLQTPSVKKPIKKIEEKACGGKTKKR